MTCSAQTQDDTQVEEASAYVKILLIIPTWTNTGSAVGSPGVYHRAWNANAILAPIYNIGSHLLIIPLWF